MKLVWGRLGEVFWDKGVYGKQNMDWLGFREYRAQYYFSGAWK